MALRYYFANHTIIIKNIESARRTIFSQHPLLLPGGLIIHAINVLLLGFALVFIYQAGKLVLSVFKGQRASPGRFNLCSLTSFNQKVIKQVIFTRTSGKLSGRWLQGDPYTAVSSFPAAFIKVVLYCKFLASVLIGISQMKEKKRNARASDTTDFMNFFLTLKQAR